MHAGKFFPLQFGRMEHQNAPIPKQLVELRDTCNEYHLGLQANRNLERCQWDVIKKTFDGIVHVPTPIIFTHITQCGIDTTLSSNGMWSSSYLR